MNAPFDPVSFIHRLEAEGIARGAAEAIAQGIEDRNRELATSQDIDRLEVSIEKLDTDLRRELGKFATKEELRTSLARQTLQFGAMLAAGLGLAVAILGTIIALR